MIIKDISMLSLTRSTSAKPGNHFPCQEQRNTTPEYK